MKNWAGVLPVVLAAAALLLTMPFAVSAEDQARTMDQTQMYSVNDSGVAASGQYRESLMWAQQTANMGDTSQVKAGQPKTLQHKRGEELGSVEPVKARTGEGESSDRSGSGSKK